MDTLTLLREARRAGLRVRAEGDRLVVRGPRRLEPLARRLLERKAEVLEALAREGEACPSCGAQVVESPPSGSSLDWRWDSTQKRWVKDPGWWQSIPVSPRRRGR